MRKVLWIIFGLWYFENMDFVSIISRRAIIIRSWFETALHSKLRILEPKNWRITFSSLQIVCNTNRSKDLFIKNQTRAAVNLLLYWFQFLWISLYNRNCSENWVKYIQAADYNGAQTSNCFDFVWSRGCFYEYVKIRNQIWNIFFCKYIQNCISRVNIKGVLKSLTLEATPLAPNFSKGLTKLAIILDYKHPGMLCLAFPAHSKVLKLDFQSEFSMSKITSILKSLQMLKSCPIFDQATKLLRQSIQGSLKSRIIANFEDLLKNWVAKGVASDVNDFNEYLVYKN